ncbi:MAG: hypothetical protein A2X47_10830 [Lentisphaerae bacterium GWF2_38_69]|nr:MAG: hypothetical protein A2X47_10830 [Lentisphaerae bacterium GWF2_38_69]
MPQIIWDNSLSLGIREIDDQHKVLIKLINHFLEEIEKKEATVYLVKKAIDEMETYTHTHFSLEELYFKAFKYSDAPAHIKEHEHFINYVADLRKKYSPKNAFSLTSEIVSYLSAWIINHIKKTDRGYIDLFIKNGIR